MTEQHLRPVTNQTVEQIIGTHEALEKLTSDMVQFLVDLNEAMVDITGHPSCRASALLDRYFTLQDAKTASQT